LILQLVMIYLLPAFWGINGLWAAVIAVEGVGDPLPLFFFVKNGKRYGYL